VGTYSCLRFPSGAPAIPVCAAWTIMAGIRLATILMLCSPESWPAPMGLSRRARMTQPRGPRFCRSLALCLSSSWTMGSLYVACEASVAASCFSFSSAGLGATFGSVLDLLILHQAANCQYLKHHQICLTLSPTKPRKHLPISKPKFLFFIFYFFTLSNLSRAWKP
jgi:hypothetical protein